MKKGRQLHGTDEIGDRRSPVSPENLPVGGIFSLSRFSGGEAGSSSTRTDGPVLFDSSGDSILDEVLARRPTFVELTLSSSRSDLASASRTSNGEEFFMQLVVVFAAVFILFSWGVAINKTKFRPPPCG